MVGRQNESNPKNIKIAHLNTRSLKNRAHYIQIKNLVTESNFDIFTTGCIKKTEQTWNRSPAL